MTTTQERINKIIIEHLGVDPSKVILEARFDTDLGADSLDVIELVMAIEEEFTIELTDEEIMACETVKDVYDLVQATLDKDPLLYFAYSKCRWYI